MAEAVPPRLRYAKGCANTTRQPLEPENHPRKAEVTYPLARPLPLTLARTLILTLPRCPTPGTTPTPHPSPHPHPNPHQVPYPWHDRFGDGKWMQQPRVEQVSLTLTLTQPRP